jgi:hypothetical protein
LGDEGRLWGESIFRALEHEGILIRVRAGGSANGHCAPVYDALGGHLIADALLAQHGRDGFEAWVREADNLKALVGPLSDQHPLAADTFRALVGIVPRRLRQQQLWPLLENEPARTSALFYASNLEGSNLDAATVSELARLVVQAPTGSGDLFDRLLHTRGSSAHPLNSGFLDAVLRPLSVAQRDLRWTEWVRRNADNLLKDLQRLERSWHSSRQRSPADTLRAGWVK